MFRSSSWVGAKGERLLSVRQGDLRNDAPQGARRADRGPSAYHTDAGKALSFSAAGPVNGRRWRLPGMQTRDLRLLKTLKTATVALDTAGNLVNVG